MGEYTTIMVAFDPGKTTGSAMCIWVPETKTVTRFQGEQGPPDGFLDWLWQSLPAPGVKFEVGYERFIITEQTTKKSRQYEALDFIGALKWMQHYVGFPLDVHDPATAKKAVSNDKLRQLGFYTTGKEHANDAARHLVLMLLDRQWYSSAFD